MTFLACEINSAVVAGLTSAVRCTVAHSALLLILLFIPSSLYAWGREGHEIVALIAEHRLEPEVHEQAAVLLEGTAFRDAANWADHLRNKQSAPWHYVNIPITDTAYDAEKVCAQDQCIIAQIERFRNTLANPAVSFKKRQKALKYLIHFVGDLHQPLHAGDNHDRGGNDVRVEFLGQTVNPFNGKPWNLHAVWDSAIVERQDADAEHYAALLTTWLKAQPQEVFQGGSVVDWAMESHDIARDHVYVLPENHKLGGEYVQTNASVVDQQLIKAGVRLAKVLNEAFAKR
jgi:hypothetical protein